MAHYNLALAYADGTADLQPDIDIAIRHYQAAWDAGLTVASVNLADIYRDGRLVRRDRDQALDWLRRGAAAGAPNAHRALAERYERGDDVDRNLELALHHYIVATRLYEDADDESRAQATRYHRASLARNMPPQEATKVAVEAAKWSPAPPR